MPPPPELREARRVYDVAAADPMVTEGAPIELFQAAKAVERAEVAQSREARPIEVFHLANLAIKDVEIARAAARSAAAERKTERLRERRERVRYEARARQAEEAQREAEKARAQVDALIAAGGMRPAQAQGQAAQGRSGLEDLIAYHILLQEVGRERAPSPAQSNLEQRLRELELARAADREAQERVGRELAAQTRTRQMEEAAGRRAAELSSITQTAQERLQSLHSAISTAEERAVELAIATRALRPGAAAETGTADDVWLSRATLQEDADMLDSQQEVDRLLEQLRAERAESQRRIQELKLARAESEQRIRALRADRAGTARRLQELNLANRTATPSATPESAAAPSGVDSYETIELDEQFDADVATGVPEKRSAWRRAIDWLRRGDRSE